MGCGQLSCCGKFSGRRVRCTTLAALEVGQQPCSFTSAAAGVAELADALDSKSSDRKIVWVRSPPPALLLNAILRGKIDQRYRFSGCESCRTKTHSFTFYLATIRQQSWQGRPRIP